MIWCVTELFEQSADITMEVKGEHSTDYDGRLVNTAAVLMAKNDHSCTLPILQQARTIFEGTIGKQHLWYGNGVGTIGRCHEQQGELDLVLQAYAEATSGKQSESFWYTAISQFVVHQKRDEPNEALHWLTEAAAEHEAKPAIAAPVEVWRTALGHWIHNQVQ